MSQQRQYGGGDEKIGYRNCVMDTRYTKIFVGGLAWETQRESLRKYFEQFGEIIEAVVITDKLTAKSKGYGFVTFKDGESAMRAVEDPNPVIDGRRANCNLASLGSQKITPPFAAAAASPHHTSRMERFGQASPQLTQQYAFPYSMSRYSSYPQNMYSYAMNYYNAYNYNVQQQLSSSGSHGFYYNHYPIYAPQYMPQSHSTHSLRHQQQQQQQQQHQYPQLAAMQYRGINGVFAFPTTTSHSSAASANGGVTMVSAAATGGAAEARLEQKSAK